MTPEEIVAARWRRVAGVLWLLALLALFAVLGVLLALAVRGVMGGAELNRRLAALALVGTALFYAGSAARRHADQTDPAQPLARDDTDHPSVTGVSRRSRVPRSTRERHQAPVTDPGPPEVTP